MFRILAVLAERWQFPKQLDDAAVCAAVFAHRIREGVYDPEPEIASAERRATAACRAAGIDPESIQ